ncbi:hypothetical protein MicloDRAFT_00061100 [Microvirga lotononidis]|uniref:Uncharacterized protein n=1 Tax=Microvirga lotononidis TaxID=864069 RepID=I4YN42_9HYPH|nr:hypothetical protein MicloDRAFT_00061100 [Microvirga lotononidis]
MLAGDNAVVIGLAAAGPYEENPVVLYVAVEMIYRGALEVWPSMS